MLGPCSACFLSACRQLVASVRAQVLYIKFRFTAVSHKTLASKYRSTVFSYKPFFQLDTFISLSSLTSLKSHFSRKHTSPPTPTAAFSPLSRFQLQNAVGSCLKLSPRGKCSTGPHGPIGTWDVSRVIDMSRLFSGAKLFDADISKWDVSRAKDMNGMFLGASSFNGDLAKWDVSRVQDMSGMFGGATVFKRTLCGAAWVNSKAKKTSMFAGSSGLISQFTCSGVCTITELRFKLVLDYPSVNHSFTST